MVGKLIKHELVALFRILLYLGIVCLGVAVVARILIAADSGGVFTGILSFLSIAFASVLSLSALIISVSQFCRSLFTGEGYMTFSLPASPTQILISKLLSAIIASFFSAAVTALTLVIVLSGVDASIMEIIASFFGALYDTIALIFSLNPLYAVENIILMIVGIPYTLLFFYFVASLGQLFTKSRKLITVGIAIGMLIGFSVLQEYALTPILNAAADVSVHLAVWLNIIVVAGLELGFFFLIRYIMKNKINLIV